MDLTYSHASQLIAGLLLGIMMFTACFIISPKKIFAVLIILIPFQIISSQYGTLNMVLVYLIFLAFLISSKIKFWPFLLSVCCIFFIYICSTIFAPKNTWFNHTIYLITVGSDFALFYITYNMFSRDSDLKYALRLLMIMNAFAIVYSLVVFFFGAERIAFLGVSEWALNHNTMERVRLLGAFNSPGVTAIFFASQMMFLLYAAFFTEKGKLKYFCYLMVLINFALVVAEGSRGSFFALAIMLPVLIFMLKPGIGVIKVTRLAIIGSLCFVALAFYVVFQTDHNRLFEKITGTEVNALGIPDTRQQAFEMTFKELNEKIMFGHGPTIQLLIEAQKNQNIIFGQSRGLQVFPHNLILYLLYTIGVLGLVAYGVFFFLILLKLLKAKHNQHPDNSIKYVPVLGIAYLGLLFLDQLKIEYLRFMFSDYQHYIFYLLGMLTAFAKIASSKEPQTNTMDRI
ncbi:O-antigen ligase family protein [uncultured Desulfobacter sp.]|uniref:O-antigen ligase family protein n=1 Tax=uncultured Desulfobacter sp. TaxID=240139 RepID=UPI0029F48341|nr:O-antigen ligase family protein [uncultured Desulfobacter sp.]